MQYFKTEADFKQASSAHHYDIQYLDWEGPGYYEFKYSSRRCPRN
jgi:hypothetical protein